MHPDSSVYPEPDCAPYDELRLPARDLRPGDVLPPQQALHGSRFQHTGFVIGPAARDVVEVAVLSGRMLLFGPWGTLDSLPVDAEVTARRCRVACRR